MNRKVASILMILAIVTGIGLSFYMMNKNRQKDQTELDGQQSNEIAEKVTDECTEEYEQSLNQEIETTALEEEKLSPNCLITFKKYYKECGHTTIRYEEVSTDLVNVTQEQLQEHYKSWTIETFSADEVTLYKELDGECGEHYMLRDVDGYIVIYEIGTNGDEILLEETEIPTEYLTETDMISIENGLVVYGKENLNKLLEDFE